MGTQIHWLAVLAAGVAAFVVGGVWYSALFGKMWMAARGVTPEDCKQGGQGNMAVLFGTTFVLDLVMAFVLDHVLGTYGDASMNTSLMVAGGIALGFVIPAMIINYLYQQAKGALILIDGGHWIAAFLAMGAVLSLLR